VAKDNYDGTGSQGKGFFGSGNDDDPDRPRWNAETKELAQFDFHRGDGSYSFTIFKGLNTTGGLVEKVFKTMRRNMAQPGERNIWERDDWLHGLGDEEPVLYRLPELLNDLRDRPDNPVLVPEGEKDVETARGFGFIATTNPFGALKEWGTEFTEALRGRDVVIVPDNDVNGRKRIHIVARALAGIAKSVRVLELPGLKEHGDLTNWVEDGGTAEALRELVEEAYEYTSAPLVLPLPMPLARAFVEHRRPNLKHHQQEFLDWESGAYCSVAEETVRAELWSFIETCRVRDKTDKKVTKPLMPMPAMVSGALDALKGIVHVLPAGVGAPAVRWLDGRDGPDPMILLSTRNGLLNLSTGELLPPSPEFFTRSALPCDYDPAAQAPEWMRFLKQLWPDEVDEDCIAALQDFMGYVLTPDTSLQKALLMHGKPRSGKGTIGRVMVALVGPANTAGPSLSSLSKDFGLEPLIGKPFALVSDMRMSHQTDLAALAENLLRITGEDRVSVNRKHRLSYEGTLTARFAILTNELPRFSDRSGALVSRFIALPTGRSFAGGEDTDLTKKLTSELSGILNWAIAGWRRVQARRRLTEPKRGKDLTDQMTDLASPFPAFIREACQVGTGLRITKAALFQAFKRWHQEEIGFEYKSGLNVFARDLYSAAGEAVGEARLREGDGRVQAFTGISLRPDWDAM
jgi:P4 family phage/plasmid primase-like protien